MWITGETIDTSNYTARSTVAHYELSASFTPCLTVSQFDGEVPPFGHEHGERRHCFEARG